MNTILVTGFNGFIGSHLISELIPKYNIIGISNSKNSREKIHHIKQDISKINEISLPKKISTIIHLAAVSDVNYCQNNPLDASITNILGTEKILELARKKDLDLVFLSTSHVFGKPKKNPINENDKKTPQSIYAATKLSGEILCESYSNSYGLNIGTARLFSVYGPNSPQHSVINNIIKQIIAGKTIKLGNTKSKRDFFYVKDAVDAILLIMKKNRNYNDYNIGCGKSHSINQICKILLNISKKDLRIKTIKTKSRKNDSFDVVSDPRKIKSLGWKPKISLSDGLKMTYNWYLENT